MSEGSDAAGQAVMSTLFPLIHLNQPFLLCRQQQQFDGCAAGDTPQHVDTSRLAAGRSETSKCCRLAGAGRQCFVAVCAKSVCVAVTSLSFCSRGTTALYPRKVRACLPACMHACQDTVFRAVQGLEHDKALTRRDCALVAGGGLPQCIPASQ